MGHQMRSHQKYFVIGAVMLTISLVVIYVLLNYFVEKVANSDDNYQSSLCTMVNVTVDMVPFNCRNADSGLVTVVSIPCLKASVSLLDEDAASEQSLRLYRNMEERIFSARNNLDCSYIPTACDNDPSFLANYLQKSTALFFPPIGMTFKCYSNVLANAYSYYYGPDSFPASPDALLYRPDLYAYYISIGVVAWGLVLSGIIIIIGVFKFGCFDKRPSVKKFLKNHKLIKDDDELGKYIKKILDSIKTGKKVDASEATSRTAVEHA